MLDLMEQILVYWLRAGPTVHIKVFAITSRRVYDSGCNPCGGGMASSRTSCAGLEAFL